MSDRSELLRVVTSKPCKMCASHWCGTNGLSFLYGHNVAQTFPIEDHHIQ